MLQKVFCMRLNTAGIVFGWLGVVGSAILTLVVSFILAYSVEIAQSITEHLDTRFEETHATVVIVSSIYLALIVLNFISSGLLIWGTMKERHLMLLPWLINSALGIIISFTYTLSTYLMSPVDGGPDEVNTFFFFFTYIAGLAFDIYVYYGIYSLYKQIQLTRSVNHPLVEQPQDVCVEYKNNSTYAKM